MPTAIVAYEARPRPEPERTPVRWAHDDYLDRVKQTLRGLGSSDPDADLAATGDYWKKLYDEGISSPVAGALVYTTARYWNEKSSVLRAGGAAEEARKPSGSSSSRSYVGLDYMYKGWKILVFHSEGRWYGTASKKGKTLVKTDHAKLGAAGAIERAIDHPEEGANESASESPTREPWEVIVRGKLHDIIAAAGRSGVQRGSHVVFGGFYDDEQAVAFARKMTRAGFVAMTGPQKTPASPGVDMIERSAAEGFRWSEENVRNLTAAEDRVYR